MGGMSIWHWIIVGGILLLLFGGKGKISDLMGDFAKGIKSFKKGMSDDDVVESKTPAPPVSQSSVDPVRTLDHQGMANAEKATETHRVG